MSCILISVALHSCYVSVDIRFMLAPIWMLSPLLSGYIFYDMNAYLNVLIDENMYVQTTVALERLSCIVTCIIGTLIPWSTYCALDSMLILVVDIEAHLTCECRFK